MNIDGIVPPTLLADMIQQKYVRQQQHPTLPFIIRNYTETAAFSKTWNAATLNCRGLITDLSGEVVARPFTKFFNSGEHENPERSGLPTDEPVTVTDKMDGSLGILYFHEGEPWIATRGSFASEQAQHATSLYRQQYHGHWEPTEGHTYLFEIIYPGNRIVLEYEGLDDLVMLGAVDIGSEQSLSPYEAADEANWFGPVATEFPYKTYAEALAAPPRDNAEGVVVHFRESDMRVKLKQPDYVALHKIITGTSTIGVWERLRAGDDLAALAENVPDEFYDWVKQTAHELNVVHTQWVWAAQDAYRNIVSRVDPDDRKAFAMEANQHGNLRPALFALLDGKSIDDWAWKLVRPEHQLPFKQSESVA